MDASQSLRQGAVSAFKAALVVVVAGSLTVTAVYAGIGLNAAWEAGVFNATPWWFLPISEIAVHVVAALPLALVSWIVVKMFGDEIDRVISGVRS